MRKIVFGSPILLLLACRLNLSTPIPGQTPAPETPAAADTMPAGGMAQSTPESAEIVAVPFETVQIKGVAYTAWQAPGDPFRLVCEDPCKLDEQYIFAEYAGFRAARAELIRLTGIDTLAEIQPVDMHLELTDSVCQEQPTGHASVDHVGRRAYTCTQGPGWYPTVEEIIAKAAQPGQQYFPLHEYMHTLFFGRLSGMAGEVFVAHADWIHDYVNPLPAIATGDLDPADFCLRGSIAPGDFEGRLVSELCERNGFVLEDLTRSLVELDALYQSGGGQVPQERYEHPAATIAQYRDILNRVLGSDTTPAFAAACWPAVLFESGYALGPGCAQPTVDPGWTATSVPKPGAE